MERVLFLLAGLCFFAAPQQSDEDKADPKKIEQLIQHLGGSEPQRDKARAELRRIGKPAIPYLKNATRDADAERAMAARGLLLDLMGHDPKSGRGSDVRVIYRDWANGIDFVRDEDGRIKLTVPEKDAAGGKREFKTYRADSLEEFKKLHPEVARKHDVEKLASPEKISEQVRKDWEEMKKRLGIEDKESGDLESWLEKQAQEFQRRFKEWDENASPRPSLGILISPAGPALRSQLNVDVPGALVVHSVQPGSLAEKSGLRQYDVLTHLNGKPIQDVKSFRADLENALSQDRFTLKVVRGGKSSSIDVVPPASK